jgi:energy-coupling factor transport system permease protein
VSPVPAAVLLAGLAAAALLAERVLSVAALAFLLLAVCLRASSPLRKVYLLGALVPGVALFFLWPLLGVEGFEVVWSGPDVPVIGTLDVTVEEVEGAARNGLRLIAVGLAFTAYALLLDHDRLLASATVARRSALAVALATRLVPTLQRDAQGLVEALRGRGVAVAGLTGHARLLSPLVAGSLERALNLAEAMESRGFGRAEVTQAPRPAWRARDRAGLVAAAVVVVLGAVWL